MTVTSEGISSSQFPFTTRLMSWRPSTWTVSGSQSTYQVDLMPTRNQKSSILITYILITYSRLFLQVMALARLPAAYSGKLFSQRTDPIGRWNRAQLCLDGCLFVFPFVVLLYFRWGEFCSSIFNSHPSKPPKPRLLHWYGIRELYSSIFNSHPSKLTTPRLLHWYRIR